MMAEKARLMGDQNIAEQIMKTTDPRKVKGLGRKVQNWDEAKWLANRERIVTEGNFAKFTASQELKEVLLSTGDSVMVEASPMDKIWGIGMAKEDPRAVKEEEWLGTNLLGKCLMKARE